MLNLGNMSIRIRALLDREGFTEAKLAELAGVSQPTVSRAVRFPNKPYKRAGAARHKLFMYIHEKEGKYGFKPNDPHSKVIDAFNGIWDHTEAHADAIANVINALGDLRSQTSKGESKLS